MRAKLWSMAVVKNHLAAVRVSLYAATDPTFVPGQDDHLAASRRGGETALAYLARRFGLDLTGAEPAYQPQMAELSLKTWTRPEVQSILAEARTVLYQGNCLLQPPGGCALTCYHQGIDYTLTAVALSFGLGVLAKA